MSHGHIDDQPFPRGALIGAGLLIAFCIGLAASVQTGLIDVRLGEAPSRVVQSVTLTFAERDEGGIAVLDAQDQEVLAVLEPNTHGFARGVMRSLARQRMLRGLGSEEPFLLRRGSDGRLWLSDPATGEEVFLGAFGPTNERAFAVLLDKGVETQ